MPKSERMGSGGGSRLAGSKITETKGSSRGVLQKESPLTTSLFGGDLYCMKDPFGANYYTRRPPFGGTYYCEVYGFMIYG